MNTKPSTKPNGFYIPVDRRRFFKSMALASAGFTLSGYLAEALTLSPIVTQGPYYPLANNIPLDKDNDLVQLNDNLTIHEESSWGTPEQVKLKRSFKFLRMTYECWFFA